MAQAVLRIHGLSDDALGAAVTFHAEWLPQARALVQDPPGVGEDLVLIFPAAPHGHRGWRLAAVQALAREAAPNRVNAVVGDDEAAIAEALAWLEQAPGVTGQLLAVGPT